MRTKTILLSAACGLVAAAAANADSVYSVNVVGYVNKSFKAGQYAMFSNPLNTTNTLASLFYGQLTDADAGIDIYAWNSTTTTYDHYAYFGTAIGFVDDGGNDASAAAFAPGKGGWIVFQTDRTITFVGDALTSAVASLSVTVPPGWSQIGSKVPVTTSLTSAGFVPNEGDNIYKWVGTTSSWITWTVLGGGWISEDTAEDPSIEVGDAIWYQNNSSSITWNRTFNIAN